MKDLEGLYYAPGISIQRGIEIIKSIETLPDNFIEWKDKVELRHMFVSDDGGVFTIFSPEMSQVIAIHYPDNDVRDMRTKRDGTYFKYGDYSYLVKPFAMGK